MNGISTDHGVTGRLDALAQGAAHATAIVAPDGSSIRYGALADRTTRIGDALRAAGIGARDRVGLIVADNPAFALALLGTLRVATCAPLDPRLPAAQLAALADRLRLTAAVVCPSHRDRAAAALAGRPLFVLTAESGFDIEIDPAARGAPTAGAAPPGPDDTAILLVTSGSEGAPKVVPITHHNLIVRVARVARWFALTAADRSLSLMPLIHHAGLSNHLLTPLLSGGSTVLGDGADPDHALDMIARHRPTWFSASPTIVRALADRAMAAPDRIARHSLRFIRVATAHAPAALLADVERIFGIPAIQNYGLTETGMIVSNPLPPRARRHDSVGLPVADEVAVVDADGRTVPAGTIGEIVVRDDGVMSGYDGEAAAAQSFIDGRFRTGDLGTVDADGHLRLVGRRKEVINRGGATIAPVDIDTALAAHPDVAAAAAFGLPHPTLGEEVYAAIVLRAGATATADEVLRAAGDTLSPEQRPKRLFVVDALPQTLIGKPQRQALAQRFADAATRPAAAMQAALDPMESAVAGLWAQALGRDGIDPDCDFVAQGGNAEHAAALALALGVVLQVTMPAAAVLHPGTTVRTIAAMARRRP